MSQLELLQGVPSRLARPGHIDRFIYASACKYNVDVREESHKYERWRDFISVTMAAKSRDNLIASFLHFRSQAALGCQLQTLLS